MSEAGPVHVIVGAGQAGAAAAVAMRAAGFTGRIVMLGAERHLPYERPPLSKDVLIAPQNAKLTIHPETFWAEKNVECRFGETVKHLDLEESRLVLGCGEVLPFDKVVLTTGARVRPYPLLDRLGPAVHTLRNLEDAEALRGALFPGRRLLVVGGGVIGLEVAASAISLGATVTVIERADRLMARGAPPALAEVLRGLHESKGVTFELGVELADASVSPKGEITLTAADGRSFSGDLVVYGIGVVLNTELAVEAGIRVEDGILIDECGRTSDPRVFAAGDVARQWTPGAGAHLRFETWANAQNQGTGVGRATVTGEPCEFEVPWYWTDQYGHNFQVAGNPVAEEWVVRGNPEALRCTWVGLTGGVVTGALTVDNGREMRPLRTLIATRARVEDLEALANPKVDLRKLRSVPA